MPLDLSDCQFTGPALPEPFVKFELENELTKLKLLPKTTGSEGKQLKEDWDAYRRHLAQLAVRGGPLRVRNQVIEPLRQRLGYTGEIESADDVETREGRESGGDLLTTPDNAKLRAWTTDLDEDLDAPAKRGQAYRFSHLRIAQRVLLACGERVGLLTNGVELRLLISDPARPDSQVIFTLDPGWKRSRDVPDSFRLLLALVAPAGVKAIPELVDKARLQQARVTKDLRDQARQAIGRFIQETLDHPDNRQWLSEQNDREALARALWHEGLVLVYRLLFVLKLESSDDPARSFSFASTSLWRNTFSPSMALARYAPQILYDGAETGGLLEGGLRRLFKMFDAGLECTELHVKPLGGSLFGANATPVLSKLRWGERAVAHLLDQLLWTTPKKKSGARERVHYGPLDVEDLGRVYEALLELEPGIAGEPMCRLRRQKLEVVVPIAQGEKYRPRDEGEQGRRGEGEKGSKREGEMPNMGEGEQGRRGDTRRSSLPLSPSPFLPLSPPAESPEDDEELEDDDDEAPKRGKKTTVQWIEEIQPGKFYLRVGLGRKATGSYYTPHSFVRFLVQETLGPQVAERSPPDDPRPCEILKLKVLDPACGSGHFLVEACRFLGQHLYEAARLCDEKATAAERRAGSAGLLPAERQAAETAARQWRQRIIDLPDPDDELLRYLPSRVTEGEQSGYSQRRAEALCRRMVAVHCLYGVDKNPLAVELAKLALWLEAHAEGMPLTFLDHRIVVGDSLTGPFWDKLTTRPSNPKEPIEGVFHQGLTAALTRTLHEAIRYVADLEATVGISQAEIVSKQATKAEMDRALRPFRIIAAAWSGGVMLGPEKCDDFGYAELLKSVADTGDLPRWMGERAAEEAGEKGRGGEGEKGSKGRKGAREKGRRGEGEKGSKGEGEKGGEGEGENDPGECHVSPSPPLPASPPPLLAMIARGLGIQLPSPSGRGAGGEGVWTRDQLYALLDSGRCVPALSFDLTFPEVFYPQGVPYQRHGFDAVLSNPPWEALQPLAKEFFAGFDFAILAAPTRREREITEKRLLSTPSTRAAYEDYSQAIECYKRHVLILYDHVNRKAHGKASGAVTDVWQCFTQRSINLLRRNGIVGIVVPSAFHANEGATGLRELCLRQTRLRCCYSFENRRALFEIHRSYKFALVVTVAGASADTFSCAFYLHDDEWLFSDDDRRKRLQFTEDFVRRTGGENLTFLELRSQDDLIVAEVCFSHGTPFGPVGENLHIRLGQELHMAKDAALFVPTSATLDGEQDSRDPAVAQELLRRGLLALHEGKTLQQYTDRWENAPRYVVNVNRLLDKRLIIAAIPYFRLGIREVSGSTNERTLIGALLPPGTTSGHTVLHEREPQSRANWHPLALLAVVNSYVADWCVRLSAASHVTKAVLNMMPLPDARPDFLVHSALRLTCNHSGYAPLWREQVGEAWREAGKAPLTWPVLAGDDERWAVRAAIDAVVADAYGLSRDQYAHVLSTFSHASYRKAPELCLARFDELKQIGLEEFTRKHDPYWDIPLNENLPQPVIDLPIPGEDQPAAGGEYRLTGAGKGGRRSRKK